MKAIWLVIIWLIYFYLWFAGYLKPGVGLVILAIVTILILTDD